MKMPDRLGNTLNKKLVHCSEALKFALFSNQDLETHHICKGVLFPRAAFTDHYQCEYEGLGHVLGQCPMGCSGLHFLCLLGSDGASPKSQS